MIYQIMWLFFVLHFCFQSGSFKTHLVHEDLVVTERIDDLKPLGYYTYSLCEDRPTYRMQRRSEIMGKWCWLTS